MVYEVAKEKGSSRYYVHSGDNKPINGTFKKNKKDALHIAAEYSGMEYKEYMKYRKTAKEEKAV